MNVETTAGDLNSIWLEGNLISEPEMVEYQGKSRCVVRVAASRVMRQDDAVSIFDLEVREPVLDECRDFLSKGRGVRIIGRLHQDRWRDRSGSQHSQVKIICELVEFRPQFQLEEALTD